MADTSFKQVTVSEGQSLADIAIQEYGSMAGVFLIIEDNGLTSVDAIPQPGTNLNIRLLIEELGSSNRAIAKKFNTEQVKVNTGNDFDSATTRYVEEGYIVPGYIINE